jgi:hypothetical protein
VLLQLYARRAKYREPKPPRREGEKADSEGQGDRRTANVVLLVFLSRSWAAGFG